MMRRTEPEKLGDILRMAFEHYSLDGRMLELRAVECWPGIVGPSLANACGKPFIENGSMRVKVASPSLRQELNMSRSRLIALLNDAVGEEVVKDLRFI